MKPVTVQTTKYIISALTSAVAVILYCAKSSIITAYAASIYGATYAIGVDATRGYSSILDSVLSILSLDAFYFIMLTVLIAYLLLGVLLFFYWGSLGVRGAFYVVELTLAAVLCMLLTACYLCLKYHVVLSCSLGEVQISDDFSICCAVQFDMLALLGAIVVVLLTMIALTFGAEYMAREAFAYSVIIILCAFSSSIVWFILSYDLGLMTIFWEFSGLFSLLLVDTFYNRIRTTQAVSRTFAIGRFSDYWIFIALAEMAAALNTDAMPAALNSVKSMASDSAVSAVYPVDTTTLSIMVACLFVAASCKCAQFILFVWLPDAMEAPTPASALIHSSTLVVMGIFMLLRTSALFRLSAATLYVAMVVGALTVLYGAVFSVQTGDLKKAVAYSTISQVGYLYCGCGLMALRETLLYLVVHAVCKAMLFVFVGYIVHLFGGTTSLRKMGGIFYIAPDVAIYVFTLALILAGAPYTVGFVSKELIVSHILSVGGPLMALILFCWTVAFLCTPLYLFRICILPIFGRPRATRRVYRNITLLKNKSKHLAICSFDLCRLNNPIAFFIYHVRDLYISSRLTAVIHLAVMIGSLYFGEFIILLVSGFFCTSTTLLPAVSLDIAATATTALYINPYFLTRSVQYLIVSLLFTAVVYYTTINSSESLYGLRLAYVTIVAILVIQLAYSVAAHLII